MFRIKICGITNEADAVSAARAGADAIGLNFFSKSRRFVDIPTAREIAASVGDRIAKLGVFVNHTPSEIVEIMADVGLDGVQLHGDEPATVVPQLPGNVLVVRAFRCGAAGLAPLERYLADCRSAGRTPDAVLIDADAGSDYGGSGRQADWGRVEHDRELLGAMPLILAGGLTPENVAASIRLVRPYGVDVASGVESEPGRKAPELVERFVAAARGALAER